MKNIDNRKQTSMFRHRCPITRTNYKENKNVDSETLYRYFTHRHRLGDVDVKNIDNRKQTSMFSMFRHRCPITITNHIITALLIW